MTFDPNALPVPDLGLRCLKCGYNLASLPTHRCPECGRTFSLDEHIPRGDFPVVIYDGVEMRTTPEVLDLLKRAQIPYMEKLNRSVSIFGVGGATHNRSYLAVPRSCYFQVIDLLRRLFHQGELPAVQNADSPDWTCSDCGEENPGNFEVCWNCGTSASGDI